MATATKNADGTYSLTLTAREQQVVTKSAARLGVTEAKFVEQLIERRLREIYLKFRDSDAAARQDAYDAAPVATKNSVDTALGTTPTVV